MLDIARIRVNVNGAYFVAMNVLLEINISINSRISFFTEMQDVKVGRREVVPVTL
jgi:hypothetical protein